MIFTNFIVNYNNSNQRMYGIVLNLQYYKADLLNVVCIRRFELL